MTPSMDRAIFSPDDPKVRDGTYDVYGYTTNERRAQARRAQAEARAQAPPISPTQKGWPMMFAADTPMLLADVTFTTEVADAETRRIVVCTFALMPFTTQHANDLNVRSLVFDSQGLPKPSIEQMILRVDVPPQRLTFAMAPDLASQRVVMRDVDIESRLRVKVKQDRDPPAVEAVMKVSFHYPSAEDLLYIANGVNDTHYLTFESEQGDLLTSVVEDSEGTVPRHVARADGADEIRPGVFAEH